MESFKIEHFLRENPGKAFPSFQTLDAAECATLKAAVANVLGLPAEIEPLPILNTLRDNAVPVTEVNAASEEFLLVKVLKSFGITPNRDVFINWLGFDSIDRIALEELSRHFDDIFYPGPDD